jgi:hypothetical protein
MPRTKEPVSQKQLAANRANAALSTGPRTVRLETGLFTTCLNESLDSTGNPVILMTAELAGDGDIEITRAQNRNYALGEGFHRMASQSNSWALFLRYQAQAERHYRRAVEEFERLKALRSELPNEAVPEAQPEPKETTCTPSEANPFPPENPAPAAPPSSHRSSIAPVVSEGCFRTNAFFGHHRGGSDPLAFRKLGLIGQHV